MSEKRITKDDIKVPALKEATNDDINLFKKEIQDIERESTNAWLEKKRLENEQLALHNKTKEIQNTSDQYDLEGRKDYAGKIFKLICVWLVTMVLIVIAQGIDVIDFSLSENIVLALIGSTTINVLGLFYAVVNYLYKR